MGVCVCMSVRYFPFDLSSSSSAAAAVAVEAVAEKCQILFVIVTSMQIVVRIFVVVVNICNIGKF